MPKTKIYLAGPIQGMSGQNYNEFRLAEDHLKKLGLTVVHAHSLLDSIDIGGFKPEDLLCLRISEMVMCHEIITLKEWERDPDAKREVEIARLLGKPVDTIIKYIPADANKR